MVIDVQCKEEYMISLQIVVNTSTNATVVIDFFLSQYVLRAVMEFIYFS